MAQRSRMVAPVPLAVIVVALALVALLAYRLASRGEDTSIDTKLAKGERPKAPSATLPALFGSGSSSLEAYRGKVVLPRGSRWRGEGPGYVGRSVRHIGVSATPSRYS